MKKAIYLCGAMLVSSVPASAQEAAGLEKLIRDQAAALEAQQSRIEMLESRLAQLETTASAAPAAKAAEPAPSPPSRAEQQAARRDFLRQIPAGNAALRPPPDPLTAPSPSQMAQAPDETFDWSKGLPKITSSDGRFAMRIRGRLSFDTSTTFGSQFQERNITGTRARSMRIGIEGKAGDHIGYQFEADFAGNQVEIRGAYLSLTDKWGGRTYELSLGNRLTDRSLEGASSSDSVPFLDRSIAAPATGPRKGSFGLGAMARVYGKTWHAAFQVDGNDVSSNGSVSDSVTYTGRIHWNPWRSPDAVVHLGAWAYREDFVKSLASASLSQRVGGRFNDLVTVQAASFLQPDRGQAFGIETAATWKSAWVIGEYGERDVWARESAGGRHVGVAAGSISAGYFLTGEKPPYVARGGTWSKPRVLHSLVDGGAGAIEVAARYDRLKYSGPFGGEGSAATLGLNWYLIDWVRLALNAIHWRTENRAGQFIGEDEGDTLIGRVQVSF